MINRKKTQRIYQEEGLAVRRRGQPQACCRDEGAGSVPGSAEPALEPGLCA